MSKRLVDTDVCELCSRWAAKCFNASLAVQDPAEITFWYDYNHSQGGYIEYKSTRSVPQIHAERKTCWFCARWWFLHRFWDRNGSLDEQEYHSDQDILQQFQHAPYHGSVELCVTAEFYLDVRDGQEHGNGDRFRVSAWRFGAISTQSTYAEFQETWLPSPETDDWFPLDRVLSYKLNECELRLMPCASMGAVIPTCLEAPEAKREESIKQADESGCLTPDRIMVVKHWLDRCDTSHDCWDQRWAGLPTRLLRLGPGSFVWLVETAQINPEPLPVYATLSHCWGDSKADQLRHRDYHERLLGFDEGTLNRTNLEAIRICRELKTEYIWIDSLCIIQDSPGNRDWILEAPRMDLVYGNSYLNISATVARSGPDGAISVPAKPLGKAMRVRLSKESIAQTKTFTSPFYASAFRNSPVNTRGWIQQEIFLAHRVLHITDEELVWTCQCAIWAEITEASQLHESDYQRLAPRPLEVILLVEGGFVGSELDERWRYVARQFAGTMVTFDHDRYMALMGLASHFDFFGYLDLSSADYTAGCWDQTLLKDIMWVSRGSVEVPSSLYIPSWSWLKSRGTQLSFPIDEPANDTTSFKACAELLEVDKQLALDELEYGPVIWAAMYLRGSVMTIHASAVREWADSLSDEPIRSPTSADLIWTSTTSAVSGEEIFLEAANQHRCRFQDINYMTMRMLEIYWDDPITSRSDQTALRVIWLWEERCKRSACWDDGQGVDYLGLLLESVDSDDPAAIAYRMSPGNEVATSILYKRVGTIKLPVTDPKMVDENHPIYEALVKLNRLFSPENSLIEEIVII